MRHLILISALLLALGSEAWAATYYVSTTGDDARSCSQATSSTTPKRTPNNAIANCVNPGDTLYLRGGTYTTTSITMGTKKGFSTNRITIASAPGETAVIQPGRDFRPITDDSFAYTTFERIKFDGVNHVITLNGVMHNRGIVVRGPGVWFINNEITGFTDNGLYIDNGHDAVLRGNHIHDQRTDCISGRRYYAVYVHDADRVLIENEHWHHNPGGGAHIYPGPILNLVLRNSRIHDDNWCSTSQVGGITIAEETPTNGGGQISNAQIYNNLVYNEGRAVAPGGIDNGYTVGIKVGQGADNTKVWNNTVYNTNGYNILTQTAASTGPPLNSVIQNNISYLAQIADYLNCSTCTTTQSFNLFGVNPLFVDAAAGDFHLRSTSPAINAGTTISIVTTDYEGQPRVPPYDIGADEFSSATIGTPGFIEPTGSAFTRAKLTASQISAFMTASRGTFTFPAPYNTRGYRLTIPSDCGGQDCVNYHGYSYWMQMNNHVGQPDMYIMLGLSQLNGGPGMTLLKLTKSTGVVTKLGNLFPATGFSVEQGMTGEMMYFSYGQATKLYYPLNQQLKRYDILSQTAETVVDIMNRTALLPDGSSTSLGCVTGNCPRRLWAWHSNFNDTIHGGALRTTSGGYLGCLVYNSATNVFRFYPTIAGATFDECILDRTGTWTMSQEDVGVPNDEVNRIFNNTTGVEFRRTSSVGNLAHIDTGYDYIIGQDGHGTEPSRSARYFFTDPMTTTTLHYSASFTAAIMNHITHSNAVPTTTRPLSNQYFCGSNADNNTHENELVCARADGIAPLQQLIVAPLMSRLNATGGNGAGCSDQNYCKLPKGALDITGRYFMWTSNLGGSRLDAFIVEVPGELLIGTWTDTDPPPPLDTDPPAPPSNVRITRILDLIREESES